MKKAFLALALMLTTMTASAQWYAGGGIGFSRTESNGIAATEFIFTPEVGYNINNNWAVGAILEVDWVKDTQTIFAFTPYVRYTFYKAGNFSFFTDGEVEVGSIKSEGMDTDMLLGIGIKPGIGYHFTKRFSAEAHIGWIGHRSYGDYGEATAISFDSRDITFSVYYNF